MLSPTAPIDRPSLHPGTGYLIAPRVPHGLAAVVEGLTREVLRHRPEDIYVFAAGHFEKLLKLREEYHAEEYSDRAFSHEFSRDFNLWPTKETRNIRRPSNGGWSLEKEIEILERRGQVPTDAEESLEDSVSTDRENRKVSKQTCSRSPAKTAKRVSKRSKDNETTSDARTSRIISQMTGGKNIQTKDIKQELRRNKLSGEKSKTTDNIEKGIRGDRRSRTRIPKTDKGPEEEVEHATTTTTTTTTTSSSRTSARRPLKKVRRIETESETETEREVAAKAGLENRHTRASVKNGGASCEAVPRNGSRDKRLGTRFSEHSSERKVSSRALSMDRIRAYVLRKFASTASLEVLRSPTYVEQVQEVIDRAAPIIKEKLEEIGRPRGKRSRSVDLAWNGESLRRHEGRRGNHEEKESGKRRSGNGLERKADTMKKEEDSLGRDETVLNVEREEKKLRRRSVGSGKRSRRRESGGFGVVDQVDDNSKHTDRLEHESGATRDTLEARLTATQSILEGISKSTSELGGARRSDPAGSEPSESEVSDHVNVVSLPVVRPPSSKNSRNATRNGSDSLTLPPISPEAPKSTKKKDELSLPVLPAASNGNHSARKPQDVSKDAEDASTMHDITSDIEDIAILPDHEDVIADAKQDPGSDRQGQTSDIRLIDEEERGKDEVLQEGALAKLDERHGSLEEFEELEEIEEGRRSEEIFRDSLNVTPEVVDVPLRPDSLESDEDEVKLRDGNADSTRENTFDRLKDKLIEIEMAERSIEKALACQQVATCDVGEMTSQAEKLMTDGKINEAGEPTNEAEETLSELQKSTGAGKISINIDDVGSKKNNDEEERKSTNDAKDVAEISNKTEDLNIEERLTNEAEEMESEIKGSTNEIENLINKAETPTNEIKKSANESEAGELKNNTKILKNGIEKTIDQTEIMTKTTENAVEAEDERSTDKVERSINEKLPNGIEELAIKVHVGNVQSINPRSRGKEIIRDSQITEVVETDGDNATASKKKAENTANGFSKSTTSGNAAIKSEISTNLPDESGRKKARKKRDIDKLPATTPLSLEVPFSYVLSEGSPCEIPDFVTTVIFPDRPCLSPVTLEDENYQPKSANRKEESLIRFDMAKEISKDERQDQYGYGIEAFGEHIRPEAAIVPIDTDFMRGGKGLKPCQDIVIIHQDLDRIKEEGEEEEEKENEQKDIEDHQKKKNNKEIVQEEVMKKLAMLEDIVEHEENEETVVKAIGSKNIEENKEIDVKAIGSKDAEENEKTDVKAIGSKDAEENEETYVKAIGSKDAEENEETYVKAIGSKDAEENKETDVKAIGSKDAEENEETDVKAIESKDAEVNEETDVKAIESKDAEVNEETDVKAIESKDAEVNEEIDVKAIGSKDAEKNEETNVKAIESKDAEVNEETDVKAIGSKDAEENEKTDVKAIGSKDVEENEEIDVKAIGSKNAEENKETDVKAIGSKDAEVNEETDVKAIGSKNAEENEETDVKAIRSKDAEENEETDVKAIESKDAEKNEETNVKAIESKDAEVNEETDVKAIGSKDAEEIKETDVKAIESKDAEVNEETDVKAIGSKDAEQNEKTDVKAIGSKDAEVNEETDVKVIGSKDAEENKETDVKAIESKDAEVNEETDVKAIGSKDAEENEETDVKAIGSKDAEVNEETDVKAIGSKDAEENEEADVRTNGSKDAEKISSSGILEYEFLPDTKDLIIDTGLADEGRTDIIKTRGTLENSSEESGSTQDTHTTTSSDVKESTASNRSIDSPSLGRPVVPELNLDSLLDNTVSSFKVTANGTGKEDNDSLRESDASTSLIEPLTSDERLMNRLTLADHEEEIVAEELTGRGLQSEVPEPDQLYPAEHAEYEWLEKDPLSTEFNLEDEARLQEDNINLKVLSEDAVQVDPLLQEKTEREEGSEEEIARELIGLLDKDMELRAKELDLETESKDSERESEKSNLDVDDKSNQPLSTSMHSMSIEQEEREHEISLGRIDSIVRTAMISELSGDVANINKDNKNKILPITDKETVKLKVAEEERIGNSQVAPLAQFEQDELFDENGRLVMDDEKLTIKDKCDITNADHADIQEKLEAKQTNIGEVLESQSSESKIDENKKEEKSEDLSAQIEKVHGPIISTISEQSTEDYSRFEHWIMRTKSSTVETVIEAFGSNTSTDEKTEIVADAPEIIADESLIRKKDDFHSAVVKIQACIRGFLARRRMRNLSSKLVLDDIPPTQKIATAEPREFLINKFAEGKATKEVIPSASVDSEGSGVRSRKDVKKKKKIIATERREQSEGTKVSQDTSILRETRRLRREEALRNTTLSLENAFATGRLQHTGEFHDSVPLPLFDLTNNETDSTNSNDSLSEEIKKDVENASQPDIAKSSANESDSVHDSEHGASFHKGNSFVDHPTFPIVMHLLADASRNCHFTVSQNSHSDFNASVKGAKPVEPTVDIVMLDYPRDDENQYLNFITSVEDLGSNMNSLTQDDVIRSAKNADDDPSTTTGKGSLREPLALPGVSQGVVIEEVISLDEPVPSESTKLSTAPKTSLDTNSSMPSEECALEDTKNNLGMSPRTADALGDRTHMDHEVEGQKSDRNLGSVEESDLRSEDANKRPNGIPHGSREHVEEEKNDKT